MYDIKIFLENNGQFWAKVNAGKETIYWVWNTREELMENIRDWLKISFQDKEKNEKESRIFRYFNSDKKDLVCH